MKRPAFQFYPADWLSSSSILLMAPAEEGAFIRLLCHAWMADDCGLPDDDQLLAVLSRLGKTWKKSSVTLRGRFISRNGRLYNEKLLGIRAATDEFRDSARVSGKKGAEKRWGTPSEKHRVPIADPIANPIHNPIDTPSQKNGSSSSSSSSIKNIGFSSLQKTFAEFGKPTNNRNWSRAAEAAVNSDLGDEEILGQVVPWFQERYAHTDPNFIPKPEDLLFKKPYPWRASQPVVEPGRPKRTYDPIEPLEEGFFADCEDALNG